MTSLKLNAKTLVIDLLLAASDRPITIRQLISAARLFDISENQIRVATTRLCNEHKIEAISRGTYRLAQQSHDWADIIVNRQQGILKTRPWQQQYIAVFSNSLGRVDRAALSRRERALKRFGFKELEQGVFIRPDNLTLSLDDIFCELVNAGVELTVKIALIHSFDEKTQQSIPKLWDTSKFEKNYIKYNTIIEKWLTEYPHLNINDAARESFLLGRETIALLMTDPLLPEAFVDVNLRDRFIQNVTELDRTGLKIWHSLNTESL